MYNIPIFKSKIGMKNKINWNQIFSSDYSENIDLDLLKKGEPSELFEENDISEADNVCEKIFGEKNMGGDFLKLAVFMTIVNNNGKTPKSWFSSFSRSTVSLDIKVVNDFMQKNFMYNGVLGRFPITSEAKVAFMNEHSEFLSKLLLKFSSVSSGIEGEAKVDTVKYNGDGSQDYSKLLDSVKSTMDKGGTVHLRLLGTNNIIFGQMLGEVKNFLGSLNEEQRQKIQIELLSKTGINNALADRIFGIFPISKGEDDLPEIQMMSEMTRNNLGEFGVKIVEVSCAGNFVSTTKTVQEADKKDETKIKDGDLCVYFGVSNAGYRQILDIELERLNKGQTYKCFGTDCGGLEALKGYLTDLVEVMKANEQKLNAFKVHSKQTSEYQEVVVYNPRLKDNKEIVVLDTLDKVKAAKEKNERFNSVCEKMLKLYDSATLESIAKSSWTQKEISNREAAQNSSGRN